MAASVYCGLLVDSLPDWSLRVEEGVLVVGGSRILERATRDQLTEVLTRHHVASENVVFLSTSQFLLPGLIDTHIHASQFPNAGLALELPLLEWLEKYTFPTEAKFSQPHFYTQVYERCVRATLSSGTTTAAYFATIHREATEALAEACIAQGQRAFIGKVCMDRNSPGYYVETTEESLQETEKFLHKVESLKSELVRPIITPRFVPTCSNQLLTGLGKMAAERGLHVQTHVSESINEVHWVKKLEPDCDTYTQVYEKAGLLGPCTVLAHGVHLTDTELEIIRRNGAGVSHCPNSNFSLKSGICDVQRLRRAGVKVGLGTDCSGGYSPSMLDSMRLAVVASNTLHLTNSHKASEKVETTRAPLDFTSVLYLATRGGAGLLSMEDSLGSLEAGKLADILLIDMEGHSHTQPFGHETHRDLVHKFVFLGDDRNVLRVIVNGTIVKDIKQSSEQN